MGFQADAFVRSLSFHLEYRREAVPEGHVPTLEILRPDGTAFVPTEIHDDEILSGRRMEPLATRMITVDAPEPGFWRALVDGENQLPNSKDWNLSFFLDLEHPLTLEARFAFTSDCSPCWIFEAFLEGEIVVEHLRARGSISRRIEVTDDGELFGDPWDLHLRDDGRGYDRVADDGRYTSRPWAEPGSAVGVAENSESENGMPEPVSIIAEMVGLAGGHPFYRRTFEDQEASSEASLPYPHLESDRSYDLIPDPTIAQAYRTRGLPVSSPLGTFRLDRFTRDGDAQISWPAPFGEDLAAVLLYGAEPPTKLSELHMLLLMLWSAEFPISVEPTG